LKRKPKRSTPPLRRAVARQKTRRIDCPYIFSTFVETGVENFSTVEISGGYRVCPVFSAGKNRHFSRLFHQKNKVFNNPGIPNIPLLCYTGCKSRL
jgi:hypothetical protein